MGSRFTERPSHKINNKSNQNINWKSDWERHLTLTSDLHMHPHIHVWSLHTCIHTWIHTYYGHTHKFKIKWRKNTNNNNHFKMMSLSRWKGTLGICPADLSQSDWLVFVYKVIICPSSVLFNDNLYFSSECPFEGVSQCWGSRFTQFSLSLLWRWWSYFRSCPVCPSW